MKLHIIVSEGGLLPPWYYGLTKVERSIIHPRWDSIYTLIPLNFMFKFVYFLQFLWLNMRTSFSFRDQILIKGNASRYCLDKIEEDVSDIKGDINRIKDFVKFMGKERS